ncbi:MAG TPA: hypothetical protein PKD59_15185 [Miltoncostaeaceae bacterium]|nr:hypothetical protein [Miltoncostaeaceae bacterium]
MLLTAGAAALAATAVAPALASAAWADPQTICSSCTEADGLVSFAEAPNGAAVAAWHGNRATVAAYRAPNADTFGPAFTVATGGKPEFVRAAIGADGTAAVATWLPGVTNSNVVARITPTQPTWSVVPAPLNADNAHIALGPNGSVTAVVMVANSPTDQKLYAANLAPGATAFSPPIQLYSLAAPYNGFDGVTLAGNGQGTFVAGWTLLTGASSGTQAFASYSANATAWTAPELVGTAPSTLGSIGVDGDGNALATYTGGAQPQSVYRSYLDDGWRTPTVIPAGTPGALGFDLVGNAALTGSGYSVRDVGSGAYSPSQALGPGGTSALAVAPAGDTLVLQQNGGNLTSSWGSTLTASTLANVEALPGTGTRAVIGAGLDQNSLGTAVWASAPGSGLGSVFASTRPAGAGGEVTLSTGQLLTNQRISQAAVLRSNGALNALDAGLPATAFRTTAFGAPAFGASVPLTGTAKPGTPSKALNYVVPVPKKTGGGGQVELTTQQLLINQRISQAAVLRSNAVRDRLASGLTASQIGSGVFGSANLLPGLAFGTLGANSPGTPIVVPKPNNGSGSNVTLSAQQLLINQRISQVAVRRANLNIASLQAGLTQDAIAPGGIASQNVKP